MCLFTYAALLNARRASTLCASNAHAVSTGLMPMLLAQVLAQVCLCCQHRFNAHAVSTGLNAYAVSTGVPMLLAQVLAQVCPCC